MFYVFEWSYRACISKWVCSVPLAEDGAASCWLFSSEFISWTGGGLTMVIGMTRSSERRPFISLCSWHNAHQCMQQWTMQGSHGEFCEFSKRCMSLNSREQMKKLVSVLQNPESKPFNSTKYKRPNADCNLEPLILILQEWIL